MAYSTIEDARRAMTLHLRAAHGALLHAGALPDPETRRVIEGHLAHYEAAERALTRLLAVQDRQAS